MKKLGLILMLFCTTIVFSQEKNFEEEVKKISNRIELITKTEKAALREKVEKIRTNDWERQQEYITNQKQRHFCKC